MKFRTKPCEIEAHKLDALGGPTWLINAILDKILVFHRGATRPFVVINTPEGVMSAHIDDSWIIKGLKGELYACRDDVFQLKYEPAE